jgi:hypothetical protein
LRIHGLAGSAHHSCSGVQVGERRGLSELGRRIIERPATA